MKRTLLSTVAIAALTHGLLAESVTLEPLTITSTAIETDELRTTDAVEIYTQKDIEKAHVQNIYEFFNQQTSLTTMPSYGNPFTQKMDIHGYGMGDGHQNIVVNINGRRLNNIDLVPQMLAGISPGSIERIEIIKSSGIVTGGDGANAGVINITTKKSNDKEVSFYGGTYGTFDGAFYVGHSDEKLSASVSGEARKSNGIRHIDSEGNKDANQLVTAAIDLAYMPVEAVELRLNAAFAKTDVDYAGFITKEQYEDDPTQEGTSYTSQEYDTEVIGVGLTYFIDETLSIDLDANREKKSSDSLNVSAFGPYAWAADYRYDSFGGSVDYLSDLLDLSIGIDGFKGRRESHATLYGIANKTTKEDFAGYVMSQWHLGDSTFKAGYRYEKVSYDFQDATQTNSDEHDLYGVELGYSYRLDEQKSLFANYAHSYQAPDIDRFFSYGAFNDFIEPMEADSYTVGFNYLLPSNKLKISAYYIDLKDEIYYYQDLVNFFPAPSLSINTNIDKSYKYGFDLYDKWIITPEFDFVFNYNYVQAVIDEEIGRNGEDYSGNTLPGVPEHNVKATLSYLPNQNTTLSLTQVYRSEAYAANDFGNEFAQKQDAYNSTDIAVTYATDSYEVFAKINNLFDQSNGIWIQDDAIYPVNFTTTAIAGLKLKY